MGSVYIVLMILILMGTVFEMYALYTGDWEFPFWYIGGSVRRAISSVFGMSLLAFGLWITYGWVSAVLSLAAYIFVYIALYFYITMKAPRKIYLKKRSASGIIFQIVIVTVAILGMALDELDDSQNAAFIINFFLFNIFFIFLPLYYLFEIREQKLEEKRQQEEEKRQQEEEKRRQEDERRYQEEEERRKGKEEDWIVVTKEMNTNSKSEENL